MVDSAGFVGEYLHSLDLKGRIALPVRFREVLGSRFVLGRGLDKCLFIYPLDEWARVLEKVKAMPLSQREARNFARYFLSGAVEVEPDKQGRITVPSNLREYAGLEKDVYVLGVGTRIEIWDKATWESTRMEIEENFSDLAESVTGI